MSTTPAVLLVDDSQADVKLTLRAFGEIRPSHDIKVVRDGAEALKYIFGTDHDFEYPAAQTPRLILLDLKLPKINGFEVLRALKLNPHTHSIPVVILTSSKQESDIRDCYMIGANSYVQKPVDFDVFRQVIREIDTYWLRVNQAPPASGPAISEIKNVKK
jgi:two-component system response regulator